MSPSYESYLPAQETKLDEWIDNFIKVLLAHAEEWELPADVLQALQDKAALFHTLLLKVNSPERTPDVTKAKNEAKDAVVEDIRGLVNFQLRNPVITNPQRLELGLKVHDKKPTAIPAPGTSPVFTVKLQEIRQLDIWFTGKPRGCNGAVIFYAVLDKAPADISELTHSALASRSPYKLTFTEGERGKKVYIALAWETTRGLKGPYSEIFEAYVP